MRFLALNFDYHAEALAHISEWMNDKTKQVSMYLNAKEDCQKVEKSKDLIPEIASSGDTTDVPTETYAYSFSMVS